MDVSAETLRTLHRIHRQLADLRGRLQRGPRQVQSAEQNVRRLQQAGDEARQLVTKTRLAADQKELQLQEREARIEDLRRKLNTCSSNREYQAILEQIAADEQANSVLSDEILELLDKVTHLQQRAQQTQEELAKGKADFEKIRQRVQNERQVLEDDVARVRHELDEAEAKLPSDFRRDYQRIVRARGEDALAPLEGDCCGACYQTVTPQMLNDVAMGRPVFCKACGSILYRPEGR